MNLFGIYLFVPERMQTILVELQFKHAFFRKSSFRSILLQTQYTANIFLTDQKNDEVTFKTKMMILKFFATVFFRVISLSS